MPARVEGERIAAVLGVRPWLDSAMLDGRLEVECRSPRILHLATHGFVIEDHERDPNQEGRDFAGLGVSGRMTGPVPEDPLPRAGLVLAGANTRHATGEFHGRAEDGLLTAEDVSGLDLLTAEILDDPDFGDGGNPRLGAARTLSGDPGGLPKLDPPAETAPEPKK